MRGLPGRFRGRHPRIAPLASSDWSRRTIPSDTLRGIRRTVGAAPVRKSPVLADATRAMALSATARRSC
jgi:hypothetical protein